MGARTTSHPLRLLRISSVLLAAALLLPLLGSSLLTLSVLVFVAGLPIAPGFTAAYGLIDSLARRGTAAEAFAWLGTAVATGIAVGTSVGGVLVDTVSVRASFALGCCGGLLAALLAVFGRGLDDG